MKNSYCFVLFLFFSVVVIGQKPKQIPFQYFKWNYPVISTNYTRLAITIDESPIMFSAIKKTAGANSTLLNIDKIANVDISSNIIKELDLWHFQTVPYNKADLFLYIKPIANNFIISATKNKGSELRKTTRFTGKIDFSAEIEILIKDKEQNVLYTNRLKRNMSLYTISSFDNQHLGSEELALKLAEDYFFNKLTEITNEANDNYLYVIIHKTIEEVKTVLDLRKIKAKFYGYNFKNKKGFDFDGIQKSIESLKEIDKWEYSDSYSNDLSEKLEPLIKFWNTEALKYDKENRAEKKIYWGLLANASGAYYALERFEDALAVYKKIEEVDYRTNFNYLQELPFNALKLKEEFLNKVDNKNPLNNFRGTHDPINVHYINNTENLLGTNWILQDSLVIQVKNKKAKLLSRILGQYSYLKELAKFSEKFNKRGEEIIGFESIDEYFVQVFERVVNEAEDLRYEDLSFLESEDKMLVTKILKDLFKFYDLFRNELKYDDSPSGNLSEEIEQHFMAKAILLSQMFYILVDSQEELKNDIENLCNRLLLFENDTLLDLSYLNLLANELTTEENLTFKKNERLFRLVLKKYKKMYGANFFGKNTYLKNIHHGTRATFENHFDFYRSIYNGKIEKLGTLSKPEKDQDNVADILTIFIK